MSLTATAVTLSLISSLVPLLMLARRDPKRLRSSAVATLKPHSAASRQMLTVAALLPGITLMGLGYWPAFLIWLGGLTVAGWALVQLLAARRA